MAKSVENYLVALARVDAAATPAWYNRSGFSGAAPTRSAAGVYALTLTDGVDATKIQVKLTLESASVTQGTAIYELSSDTMLRVRTFDAGVATDIDFSIEVTRVP